MTSAALTGHRPERLGYAKDTYSTESWGRVIDWLKAQIIKIKLQMFTVAWQMVVTSHME